MDIPIGYTLRFTGDIPEDYLELNGQIVSVNEYPELCRWLVWNVGDMSYRIDDMHFRLPVWDISGIWPGSRAAMRAKNPDVIEEPWYELIPNPPIPSGYLDWRAPNEFELLCPD